MDFTNSLRYGTMHKSKIFSCFILKIEFDRNCLLLANTRFHPRFLVGPVVLIVLVVSVLLCLVCRHLVCSMLLVSPDYSILDCPFGFL